MQTGARTWRNVERVHDGDKIQDQGHRNRSLSGLGKDERWSVVGL